MSLNAVSNATVQRLGPVVFTRMDLAPPPYSQFAGSLVLGGLGLLLTGFGLLDFRDQSVREGLGPLFLGLSLLSLCAFFLWRRAASRRALTVHERGLVVSRKGVDTVIPYLQVQDVSFSEVQRHRNGRLAGLLRRMDFTWSRGEVRLSHFVKAGAEDDPLAPVFSTMLDALASAAESRLQKGGGLSGKGWTLDARGLNAGGQGALPLKTLAGVARFEDQVSFWRADEELPFFSVPEGSPNARLLGLLVQRQLPERPRAMTGSLGHVLFQRKRGPVSRVLRWGAAGLLGLMGGVMIGSGAMHGVDSWEEGVGILVVMGALWGGAAALVYSTLIDLRVYEQGVTRKVLNPRTLRYAEIIGFQFNATRHYFNGIYTGTWMKMRFTPARGAPLTHSQINWGGDSDLDALRGAVAAMVARHLLARLRRGEDVAWGPTARFTPRGLWVRASGFLGKGEPRVVPYGPAIHYQVSDGQLHLFVGQEKKAATTVACAEDNFYPGLHLLGELCSAAAEAPRVTG